MVKKGFSKDPQVIDLIRYCSRLNDKTAIDLIHSRGHMISDRTYRRIKNNIKELDKTAPYDFTGKFLAFSINSILEFEETQKYLLNVVSDKESSLLEKIRAIEASQKNRASIIPILKSAHVVENLKNVINNLQEEKKEQSTHTDATPVTPQVQDTTPDIPNTDQPSMLLETTSNKVQDITKSESLENMSSDEHPIDTGMWEH